ncbi:uncharacterized protein LOC124441014 [Xenia sp. Carnegie-2017]|uniref:uncharacterized protein LOC124441014 n=1 Tax=Xenia sp. Carnegie-2017 TaxID=2897299 RepID=UPI001F041C2C|nr:uncharacterized protein LOC124441014 [Xenia sp. Carnegie-2017]
MDVYNSTSHLYEQKHSNNVEGEPMFQALALSYEENDEERYVSECPTGRSEVDAYLYECSRLCDENEPSSIDPDTVVEHFNDVFRQRINTEIEKFRVNVNDIVNEHQMNFLSTFTIQKDVDPAQEVPMHTYSRSSSMDSISQDYHSVLVEHGKGSEPMSTCQSPASTFNSYGASDSDKACVSFSPNDINFHRESDEAMRDGYVIRLLTATLQIGNALRRKEYKVV